MILQFLACVFWRAQNRDCLNCFPCCWDTLPDTHNLKQERFLKGSVQSGRAPRQRKAQKHSMEGQGRAMHLPVPQPLPLTSPASGQPRPAAAPGGQPRSTAPYDPGPPLHTRPLGDTRDLGHGSKVYDLPYHLFQCRGQVFAGWVQLSSLALPSLPFCNYSS